MSDKPDAGEALKPCPFCGSQDTPEKAVLGTGFHQTRDGMWIFCAVCHAEGPLVEPSDKAKAISAWNRRSSATRIEELEKALREIESGSFPGVVDMVCRGDYHMVVETVQNIARSALEPTP